MMSLNCMCSVGASKGKGTDHIFFEFNKSSRIAHAYPVVINEIPGNVPVFYCDSVDEKKFLTWFSSNILS